MTNEINCIEKKENRSTNNKKKKNQIKRNTDVNK